MAQKQVEIEGIGRVVLAKRRGSRSIRLSIRPDGTVRVGMPPWVPYSAGADFAARRRGWIMRHQNRTKPALLSHGHRIGKSYKLEIFCSATASRTATRVTAGTITVSSPYHHTDQQVQSAALKACHRALRREAEQLLADRLRVLAGSHGFVYSGHKIKKLSSRWGSCSEHKVISLSYFLVQLPWHLIDYVIIHELAHTRHLNHSRDFWQTVSGILPDAKQLRSEIKAYRPVLLPG